MVALVALPLVKFGCPNTPFAVAPFGWCAASAKRKTRLLPPSATQRVPSLLATMPAGLFSVAAATVPLALALPLLKLDCPNTPSAAAPFASALFFASVKRKTRWLPPSATQRVPSPPIAKRLGVWRVVALVPLPPLVRSGWPRTPSALALVAQFVALAKRKTRLLPLSAIQSVSSSPTTASLG